MDPRIGPKVSEIDGDRLESALKTMKDKQGAAALVSAGKTTYLFCSYQKDGCLVNTYSIPLNDQGKELSVVYAFNPGGEIAAKEIQSAIYSTMQAGR